MAFPESSLARSSTYVQVRLLGQGACGNVYFAVDAELGRRVAVKEALPGGGFIETQLRFKKEAQLHANLNHPNIIQVYQLAKDEQTSELYLICEYANGGSLADYLQSHGPLAEPEAIRIALDLCAALEAVWGQRIVHRDVKPSNILLCTDTQGRITTAKLADFGVARDLKRQPTTQRGGSHPGTQGYMAPEQADSTRPVDVRTDLFALGICLREMLTGTSDGASDLLGNGLTNVGLAEVIRRAVQPLPADRYQTPLAMAAALHDVAAGRPLRAPPTIQVPVPAPEQRTGLQVSAPPHRPQQHQAPGHWPVLQRTARLRWGALLTILILVLSLGGAWLWSRSWRYAREAESPDAANVGQTLTRSQASNTQVHGQFGTAPDATSWPAQPGYVQYDNISIPWRDHFVLNLRYSKYSPASVPIQVFLDAEPAPRATILPLDQGDWDRFVWTAPLDLGSIEPGVHSMKFVTSGEAFGVADLDAFTLTVRP